MKRIFILITICSVLALPVLAAAPDNFDKPMPATNIEVVKKIFSEDIGKIKDKPSPLKTGGAATGILGTTATGKKYAIVIGICDYPGTNLDLCQSDGDSLHMYKALTTLYGYDSANIRLFKDTGGTTYFEENPNDKVPSIITEVPTRKNILNAIDTIKTTTTSGDEVVFFFSGHGARGKIADVGNEDIDEAMLVYNNNSTGTDYIWDEELRILFSDFPTSRIVFVFDTCLAGGMNDVASVGRVVNMATGETQSAYVYSTAGEDVDGDGIKDGEGVFSRYFVNEGILQGLADGYNQLKTTDNNVAVEEAFDYTKTTIPLKHPYLKQKQKPVISDKFVSDLLL